jgi:hypothetical protein
MAPILAADLRYDKLGHSAKRVPRPKRRWKYSHVKRRNKSAVASRVSNSRLLTLLRSSHFSNIVVKGVFPDGANSLRIRRLGIGEAYAKKEKLRKLTSMQLRVPGF